MPVTIRLASEHDAADIAELSRSAIEHGLPWSWNAQRVAGAIADPGTNVIVACSAGALVGFGVMEYEDEMAHLVLFAIDGPARRSGLGSRLLAWLEKVATTGGITEIRLEARADNAGAIAFYEKHGYTEQAEVLGMYYGAEDGVRLVKRLRTDPSA